MDKVTEPCLLFELRFLESNASCHDYLTSLFSAISFSERFLSAAFLGSEGIFSEKCGMYSKWCLGCVRFVRRGAFRQVKAVLMGWMPLPCLPSL